MSKAPKPLSVEFGVFNIHGEERRRADEGFIHRFGRKVFDKEIQPIHDQGIMSIFHHAPNEYTRWYAEIVAFVVNERLLKATYINPAW